MSIRDKYVFITTRSEDKQCVGIKEGPFAGVVYKYGKVSLGEENSNGTLPFRFEYDILDNNLIPKDESSWAILVISSCGAGSNLLIFNKLKKKC